MNFLVGVRSLNKLACLIKTFNTSENSCTGKQINAESHEKFEAIVTHFLWLWVLQNTIKSGEEVK